MSEELREGIVPVEEGGEPVGGEPSPAPVPLEERSREELLELFLRARADLENARRRFLRQEEQLRAEARLELLRDLLPVLDSFERALSIPEEGEGFREGIGRIERMLRSVLERAGVEEVAAEGELFDPGLHEAVEIVPAGGGRDGEVAGVLQKGYRAGGVLLRPARVRVAKGE